MVRSDRTMGGFFQERVRERAEAAQERRSLLRVQLLQGAPERPAAALEPRLDERPPLAGELEDGAAAIGLVLAAADEPMVLEIPRELARGGQGEAELGRQLADRATSLARDGVEQRDVASTERRVSCEELQELGREAVPAPEAAHDAAKRAAKILGFAAHLVIVILG